MRSASTYTPACHISCTEFANPKSNKEGNVISLPIMVPTSITDAPTLQLAERKIATEAKSHNGMSHRIQVGTLGCKAKAPRNGITNSPLQYSQDGSSEATACAYSSPSVCPLPPQLLSIEQSQPPPSTRLPSQQQDGHNHAGRKKLYQPLLPVPVVVVPCCC